MRARARKCLGASSVHVVRVCERVCVCMRVPTHVCERVRDAAVQRPGARACSRRRAVGTVTVVGISPRTAECPQSRRPGKVARWLYLPQMPLWTQL